MVFLINLAHLAWRDMSCAQLLWREMAPYIDIDAVTVFNAKSALSEAHHCADALTHGGDQMDAGCNGRIRSGHAVNGIGALRTVQPRLKASIDRGILRLRMQI
ncbi:MAG: hypothetical protein M3Y93_13550 [Pseudomonadota bacterium]|nr:hypothetical protein [Pseudomonadota bacterium]